MDDDGDADSVKVSAASTHAGSLGLHRSSRAQHGSVNYRNAVTATALSVWLSACAQSQTASPAAPQGSCPVASVSFADNTYLPASVPIERRGGLDHKATVVALCGRERFTANAYRLAMTSPDVAVAIDGPNAGVYIAEGIPVESKRHPLHDLFFEPGRPRASKRCNTKLVLRGRMIAAPALGKVARLSSPRGDAVLQFLNRTRFTAFGEGPPVVRPNLVVRVRGRRCGPQTPSPRNGGPAPEIEVDQITALR